MIHLNNVTRIALVWSGLLKKKKLALLAIIFLQWRGYTVGLWVNKQLCCENGMKKAEKGQKGLMRVAC